MKQFKVLLLTFSLIALPLSTTCAASRAKKNNEYYVRGNLGFPFYRKIKKSFDDDSVRFMPHGNIAIGMRYKKFGAEIEGGYLYFKTSSTLPGIFQTKSSLNSKTLFLNLFFYPTLLNNKIRPYVGAGVGRAFNDMGNRYNYFNSAKILSATGLKVSNAAFQGVMGVEYMLHNKFSVLTDIRYIYFGKFKQYNDIFGLRNSERLSVGTFTMGIKYKF